MGGEIGEIKELKLGNRAAKSSSLLVHTCYMYNTRNNYLSCVNNDSFPIIYTFNIVLNITSFLYKSVNLLL